MEFRGAAAVCACGAKRRLGSPCLQGELDFVAAKRQQKTERIFVLPTLGILTAFI